ncbi:MAG TPA: hypothetical protein VN702_20830 [Acetobacteraceae bacterium]|nr:hypothetical protein [Acetobacteraceae bacterium]
MIRHLAVPRLLPATIVVAACLLSMKTVLLVRAVAAPEGTAATIQAAATSAVAAAVAPAARAIPAPEHKTAAAQPTAATSAKPPDPTPEISDSEKAVLQELRQRRKALDAREAALTARESVLAAAERKFDSRIGQLQALQTRLEGLEAARRQREDSNWQGMVKLYESMKPRDAAKIFNDLPMPVLLQIVDRMKDAKAGAILADMNADRARDLTTQLAHMRMDRDQANHDEPPTADHTTADTGGARRTDKGTAQAGG